ncbi:MAG: hypothetical protein ACRDTJ_17300, partial [Pseudonocardiaceae bacterium]
HLQVRRPRVPPARLHAARNRDEASCMTTSAADHALALRLIQDTGATLDQANAVMARFNAAGIYLVKVDPPAEPVTGPRSEDSSPHVDRLRAIVRNATKPQEEA